MQMGVSCYLMQVSSMLACRLFLLCFVACYLYLRGFFFVLVCCARLFLVFASVLVFCVVLLLCWSVVPRSCVGVCFLSATPCLSYETRGSRSERAKILDRIERKQNKCCLSEARNLKERLRQWLLVKMQFLSCSSMLDV